MAKEVNWGSQVTRDYVAKSAARERRLRTVRVGVLAILVAAVAASGTAIWAFVERQRANDEAERAQTAEGVAEERRQDAVAAERAARSLRRAALAEAAVGTDRDFAMLAAAGAYRTDASLEAESALLSSLATPVGPVQFYYEGDGDSISWTGAAMVTPEEVLVSSDDAGVDLLHLHTGQVRRSPIDLSTVDNPTFGRGIQDGTISFRGQAVEADGHVAGLLEVSAGSAIVVTHQFEVTATVGGFTDVFFGDVTGGLFRSSGSGGPATEILGLDLGGPVLDLALGPFERWLAATTPGGLQIFQSVDGDWVLVEAIEDVGPRGSEHVVFGFDGRLSLYASGSDARVRRWSIENGEVTREQDLGQHPGLVSALAVAQGGAIVVTAGEDGFHSAMGRCYRRSGRSQSDGRQVCDRQCTAAGFQSGSFRALIGGDGPLAAVTVDDRVIVEGADERPPVMRGGVGGMGRSWSSSVEQPAQGQQRRTCTDEREPGTSHRRLSRCRRRDPMFRRRGGYKETGAFFVAPV